MQHADTQVPGPAGAAPAAAAPDRTRRLLLVDDEENILRALKRLLRQDRYEIVTAASGEEGLAQLETFPAGVILSDQRMPGMSGADFLAMVKERYPRTVRLMLSGYTDLKSVTDAINRGEVYKFLTKPWEDELLRNNIREAFEFQELAEENARLTRDLAEANRALARRVEDQHRALDLHHAMLELSREVLERLPCGVLGLDGEGMVVLGNEQLHRCLGLPAGALMGRGCGEVPGGALDALLRGAPVVELAQGRFRVHTTALPGPAGPRGRIIVLIPEGCHE